MTEVDATPQPEVWPECERLVGTVDSRPCGVAYVLRLGFRWNADEGLVAAWMWQPDCRHKKIENPTIRVRGQ